MKNFIIEWYVDEKYIEPIVRHTKIRSSDMISAVYAFKSGLGSLKRKNINYIQEISNTGTPIGDKVIPHRDEKTNEITFTKKENN